MTMSSSNLGLVDVSSDIPPKRHLVAKCGTMSVLTLVQLTSAQMYSPVESSSGQGQY